MRVLINSIFELVFFFWGIRKKTIMFCSFFGQYNDNPKYISEKLHQLRADYEIVWVHAPKGHDQYPSYVKSVEFGSIKYLFYLYTARVIVDNHTGLRSGGCQKSKRLLSIYYRIRSKKKNGQLTISTWHGTPLKRIALDEPGGDNMNFYFNCDLLLSGCDYTTKCFKTAFRNMLHIEEFGTPRNDILYDNSVDVIKLKQKLGLPVDKKIVLYAPTFRRDLYLSGVKQITEDFNFPELIGALSGKFGGDWCFAFRVHNLVLQKIDVAALGAERGDMLVNANLHDDMAEYLKCIDLLITDYSASMFDIALTGKPCVLYTPDFMHYKGSERGFYMDFSELPFKYACSFPELIKMIDEFDSDDFNLRRKLFLHKIGNKEKGDAANKVATMIVSFVES